MSDRRHHTHLWPGVPLALASASLFGAVAPLSKLLLDLVNPFMLAGLMYLAQAWASRRIVFFATHSRQPLRKRTCGERICHGSPSPSAWAASSGRCC